jgi:hypothetical protein
MKETITLVMQIVTAITTLALAIAAFRTIKHSEKQTQQII